MVPGSQSPKTNRIVLTYFQLSQQNLLQEDGCLTFLFSDVLRDKIEQLINNGLADLKQRLQGRCPLHPRSQEDSPQREEELRTLQERCVLHEGSVQIQALRGKAEILCVNSSHL